MNTRKDNLIAGVIAVAMIALVFACIKAGGDEQKKRISDEPTNAPLLIGHAVNYNAPVSYPFRKPVQLEGVYLGALATNVTEEPGTNGEIIRVLNVVAKLSVQVIWDSNILQWNYDKPVSQITNRYKLVR